MNVPIVNLEERNAILNPTEGYTVYRSDKNDQFNKFSEEENRWRSYIYSQVDSDPIPIPPWVVGQPFTVEHKMSNGVAPEDITIEYNSLVLPWVTGICWLDRNLGASAIPTAVSDTGQTCQGWYFQFNQKRGHIRTANGHGDPNWIKEIRSTTDWLQVNDPAFLELGPGWRLPTMQEWDAADKPGGWVNYSQPYRDLKLHCAGQCNYYDGKLEKRGKYGFGSYWSSTRVSMDTMAVYYRMFSSSAGTTYYNKSSGYSIRPVRDLV
jgi:hypothetical protein